MIERTQLDTGLELEKVSCPLGLLAVIFEARPEAVTQISSLAIKSGNAVILKPGREVERTACVLVESIRSGLAKNASIPEALVTNIQQRTEVDELLKLDGLVDLVIPRGSYALVRHVQSATRIPVLGHSEGVCHIYVDAAANVEMALAIIDDAKTDYPAACNAVGNRSGPSRNCQFVSASAGYANDGARRPPARLPLTICALPNLVIDRVGDNEWHNEYSDLILAVKVVPGLKEAIEHIQQYGSSHSDAIVTDDAEAARLFLQQVDSAGV